ncbi:MAG: ATP-binding protein [Anaerolineaceae bacterium]|nr:ATP-binding protein [Anaerolineaceae bacterium]
MENVPQPQTQDDQVSNQKPVVRSLRELIDVVSGRSIQETSPLGESGMAEGLAFPFLALVGQAEMKLALLLALINPALGGVLLLGPRGTGKTTAARGLLDLLPQVMRSTCFYGCMPEDIETGGIDAVCPNCARKYAEGLPLATLDRVKLVELPLNATMEDVVGGLDERALVHERLRLHRGILAQADRNVLYIDEVNLLSSEIIDAILDATAQGKYTVRRGPVSSNFYSRSILIGSMNPEEGNLRPQIMDRFGLRVIVRGLSSPIESLEAYRRVHFFAKNPRGVISHYQDATSQLTQDIQAARELLDHVELDDRVAEAGIQLTQQLGLASLRAVITLFEAARAYAAADSRQMVMPSDLCAVALMALRLRRSTFMTDYLSNQTLEEDEISSLLAPLMVPGQL